MEARGYHQVLVNTFSKVHHAPPLPTAMHLRSCLLGIGPSATSFLDDMNHKNIPDIQQYQERVRQNGCAVYIGNRATPEEIEERKLVLFPNYMQIDLDDIVDYERFEEIIDCLLYTSNSQKRTWKNIKAQNELVFTDFLIVCTQI